MSELPVRLDPAGLAEKPAFWEMMTGYLIELAGKVDPGGRHDPLEAPYFDLYWSAPGRAPYWIVSGDRRVGLVVINDWALLGLGDQRTIAEFFIQPAWRRRGLGRAAALAAVRTQPGQWQLQVSRANAEGMSFWPRAVAAMADRAQEEIGHDDHVIHRFIVDA